MSTIPGTAGQSITGTPNEMYDLVSVLYHALESGTTNAQYVQDARQAGNNDLEQFFLQIQREDSARAQKAQELLGRIVRHG
ncbi:MAG: hypothetical protein IVW57_19725 [Ktedonobacterales bacterium]|nr:hypothetical protein [Ktedonobacterales bacterium]